MIHTEIGNAVIVFAATANAVSALVVLYFAQTVTAGAGFHCPLAVIQLVQRVAYFALAAFLMTDAVRIYNEWRAPDSGDLSVQGAFMFVCVLSFMRHRLSPPIPANASWSQSAYTRR